MNDDPLDLAPRSPGDPRRDTGWERETIEKLVFATLKEQQATRRWKLFSSALGQIGRGAVIGLPEEQCVDDVAPPALPSVRKS